MVGAGDHCARHGISTFGSMTQPDILFYILCYIHFSLLVCSAVFSLLLQEQGEG